jgi:hypothetical protein
MPELSQQEEAGDIVKEILSAAHDRLPICGLEQTLFSYDIPEDGIMNIYWYLHVNKRSQLSEAAVKTWIYYDLIIAEVV